MPRSSSRLSKKFCPSIHRHGGSRFNRISFVQHTEGTCKWRAVKEGRRFRSEPHLSGDRADYCSCALLQEPRPLRFIDAELLEGLAQLVEDGELHSAARLHPRRQLGGTEDHREGVRGRRAPAVVGGAPALFPLLVANTYQALLDALAPALLVRNLRLSRGGRARDEGLLRTHGLRGFLGEGRDGCRRRLLRFRGMAGRRGRPFRLLRGGRFCRRLRRLLGGRGRRGCRLRNDIDHFSAGFRCGLRRRIGQCGDGTSGLGGRRGLRGFPMKPGLLCRSSRGSELALRRVLLTERCRVSEGFLRTRADSVLPLLDVWSGSRRWPALGRHFDFHRVVTSLITLPFLLRLLSARWFRDGNAAFLLSAESAMGITHEREGK